MVLSKPDLCPDPEAFPAELQKLDSMLCVELVNNLADGGADVLRAWCRPDKTVVLLGSSCAGKSTLANRILGRELLSTSVIRESDAKGRHTTTRRSLVAMSGGAMIRDTPGMRYLNYCNIAREQALNTASRCVPDRRAVSPLLYAGGVLCRWTGSQCNGIVKRVPGRGNL